jgi:hypothetical protein
MTDKTFSTDIESKKFSWRNDGLDTACNVIQGGFTLGGSVVLGSAAGAAAFSAITGTTTLAALGATALAAAIAAAPIAIAFAAAGGILCGIARASGDRDHAQTMRSVINDMAIGTAIGTAGGNVLASFFGMADGGLPWSAMGGLVLGGTGTMLFRNPPVDQGATIAPEALLTRAVRAVGRRVNLLTSKLG